MNIVLANIKLEERGECVGRSTEICKVTQVSEVRLTCSQWDKLSDERDSDEEKDILFSSIIKNEMDKFSKNFVS